MLTRRSFSLPALGALAVVATLLTACGSDGGSPSTEPARTSTAPASARGNLDGTLAFGQLAPVTGELAPINQSLTAPVQIAVNEINAAGGVNGKPVTVVVADDTGGVGPAIARASLVKLLSIDKVDAILGPSSSGTALDLLSPLRSKGVIACSGSNSAPELSTTDSGGYYFRTAPPDRLQAVALARFVAAQGKKKPVVVVRNDAYGRAFMKPLVQELERNDVSPVGRVIRYDPAVTDLSTTAAQIAKRQGDSVVAISLADDGARLVQALDAVGVGPAKLPIYAADGMQSTSFQQKLNPANPAAAVGISGTAPAAAPAGTSEAFTTQMRIAGAEPIFSAHYYDCAILTALAAVQAGSDDPTKMARAFSKSLEGTTDCTTFAACAKALKEKQTIHYRGASSRFDRWDGHEPGEGAYDIWSYDSTGKVVSGQSGQQIHVP